MSKVKGCRLERFGTLLFDFNEGACNTFNLPLENILLCFHYFTPRQCHMYLPKTGGIGLNRTTTIYPHKETYTLGNYRGNPFIVGSHSPDNVKTEIMDRDYQWEEAAHYPFSNSNFIHYYATVSSKKAVFIIGGDGVNGLASIAKYQSSWSLVGVLNQGRQGHAAISHNDVTMIIGGHTWNSEPASTEIWDLDFDTGEETTHLLAHNAYAYGTALFLVEPDFCSK